MILGYQVKADLTAEEAERAVYDLFADPVIEQGSVSGHLLDDSSVFPHSSKPVTGTLTRPSNHLRVKEHQSQS